MEIDNIVAKISAEKNRDKYDKYMADILKKIFIRYMQNAKNDNEKLFIINIIKNVSWYWSFKVYDFFERRFSDLFSFDSVVIKYKNELSSSSVNILSTLSTCGFITEREIVKIECIRSTHLKVFIIDDFIGSGNSIIKVLKQLEKVGISREIYIISYICLEQGKEKIEEYASSSLNNIKLIYEIEEKSYLSKNLDSDLVEYINSICCRCKNQEFAFGYENSGTMISINGTSSNNNLSLLYSDDIDSWIKLLDRDVNLIELAKRREEIIKTHKKDINQFYYKEVKDFVTLKEFELLVILYNFNGLDIEILKKFNFFATISEYEEVLKSLKNKKILKESFFIEIVDRIIVEKLILFDKCIEAKYIKNKSKKFY